MQDARAAFKRCMTQTCSVVGEKFGEFAEAVGLNGFLADVFDVPRSSKEIAALALDELCEGDLGLADRIVCLAVITFLDQTLGPRKEDPTQEVRLRDLKTLVESQSTAAQFEEWIASWYE